MQSRRKYQKLDHAAMLKLFQEGHTSQEVAEILGYSVQSVRVTWSWMRKHGAEAPISKPKPKKKAPAASGHEINYAGIAKMYRCGKTCQEIAEELNYPNAKIVANAINRMKARGTLDMPKQIDSGKVGALHRAGWSAKMIARDMSIPIEQIEAELEKIQA